MRKRLTTVAAVGLLAVGIWLGTLFRGFGVGSGDDAGDQPSTDTHVNLAPEVAASSAEPVSTVASHDPDADDVLTVLVEEDRYQLQSGDDAAARFAPATLNEIATRAAAHPGDEHGVRVRLRFRRNAQSGAISDLYEALQAAGIPREQIIEASGFVD